MLPTIYAAYMPHIQYMLHTCSLQCMLPKVCAAYMPHIQYMLPTCSLQCMLPTYMVHVYNICCLHSSYSVSCLQYMLPTCSFQYMLPTVYAAYMVPMYNLCCLHAALVQYMLPTVYTTCMPPPVHAVSLLPDIAEAAAVVEASLSSSLRAHPGEAGKWKPIKLAGKTIRRGGKCCKSWG